jgi:hypothetical protein
MLSALRAGRALNSRKIPSTRFCYKLSHPQVSNGARRIRRVENVQVPLREWIPRP